jgi:glycosyltransferase involved in cell wall biosynthesis
MGLNLRICWVGGTRYTNPLDATQDKKWRTLHERLGIEIFIISFSGDWHPRFFAPHARFYLLPALPLALLRYASMYTLAPLLLLWLVFARGVRVIVTHDPYFGLIGALTKQIARIFGKRLILIVESHADFEVAVFLQRRMPFADTIQQVMNRVARYSLRHADLLRAVSSNTRQQLQNWSPPGIPLRQFITWTDMDTFKAVQREKLPSQTHDLIYVGVLIPRKGVHFLLDAFSKIALEYADSHLWLIGSADNPEYTSQLKAQVERLKLSNRVTFVGRVDQTELADYLGRCRALVLPSSSEGLPRVVVEAMLAAMPVVATCVSGIPDVIEDGTNGYLVPPENTDALETALRKVMQNPDVDRMGQQARDFAAAYFSTDAYMEGYRQLFEDAEAILSRGGAI